MLSRHTFSAALLLLSACSGETTRPTVVTAPTAAASVAPASPTPALVTDARLRFARGDEAGARKAFRAAVAQGSRPRIVLAPAPLPPDDDNRPFERILETEPHRWSDMAGRAAFQIGDGVFVLDTADWSVLRFPTFAAYDPWSFSRDGKQLAFERRIDELDIVDSASGALIQHLERADLPPQFGSYVPPPRYHGEVLTRGPAGLGAYIPNCCINPGAAVLIDLKKKSELGKLEAPGCERAETVVFGPKGAPMATTMRTRLCLWDPATRGLLGFADVDVSRGYLELLEGGQYVRFTPDGSAVVVFDPDPEGPGGNVRVYDAKTAELRQDLGKLERLDAEAHVYFDARTHEVMRITGVDAPERHRIDEGAGEIFRPWEITTATSEGLAVVDGDSLAVRHLHAEPGLWAVSESRDGKLWAGRHELGHLRVWSRDGEARMYIPAAPAVESVTELDFPHASSARLDVELWSGAGVRLDLPAGTAEPAAPVKLVPAAPPVAGGEDASLGVPVRSSDGTLVAASYGETYDYRDVRVFDAASGKELAVIDRAPRSMAFGKDRLAVAGFGSGPAVWQARSGSLLYQLDGDARVIALSTDGSRMGWMSDERVTSLHVHDGANGKPICEHEGITSLATPLAFSSDGQRLVVGDRSRVLVLDASSCAVLAELPIPSEPTAVAITPSAAMVATALADGTVVLHRVSDGALLLTLRILGDAAAAFTADGGVALFGDRTHAAALLACTLDGVPFPYDFCTDHVKAAALPEETLFR